jgi:hypothetical protein
MQKYKNLFSQVKILEGHRLPRPEPLDLIDQVIETGTGTGTETGNMIVWLLSMFIFMHERCQLVIPWVRPTEYIQSGNFRFLACNPSWWKNQPWLVRVGGARPPLALSLYYHHVQSCSVRSSWEGRYAPRISSLPYMYETVWFGPFFLPGKCKINTSEKNLPWLSKNF